VAGILLFTACVPDEQAAVKEAVRMRLIDPSTAEFREIGEIDGVVCGDVLSQSLDGQRAWRMFKAHRSASEWQITLAPPSDPYPVEATANCPGYFLIRSAAVLSERNQRQVLEWEEQNRKQKYLMDALEKTYGAQ
jgi:hypothetical protein